MNSIFHEESEKALIASILLSNTVIEEVVEKDLRTQEFYFPKNRVLFDSLLSLHQKRLPMDLITLSHELKSRGEFEAVGGKRLTDLFDDSSNPKHAAAYIRTIQEKALLRKMIGVLRQLQVDATQVNHLDEFISSMQSQILDLTALRKNCEEILVKEAFNRALLRLSESEGQTAGILTGFTDVDVMLNGLKPGNLTVVAGRPAMGKTAFLGSLLMNLYGREGVSTIFFSLEMSEEEIMNRLMAGMGRIDSTQLRACKLEFEELTRLLDISRSDKIGEANTLFDIGKITTQDIRLSCKRHLLKFKRLDLVVIDYLQIMGSKLKSDSHNRERQIAETTGDLKAIAKEFKVPVVLLSQLNRNVESRTDKRPTLADLRDSGSIEQDADVVAFLYRDEYYHPSTDKKGITEFIVAKNRHGNTGSISLKWTGKFTLLENMPKIILREAV